MMGGEAPKKKVGGARPGAGRPKSANPRKQRSQIRATDEEWELIRAFERLVKEDIETAKRALDSVKL